MNYCSWFWVFRFSLPSETTLTKFSFTECTFSLGIWHSLSTLFCCNSLMAQSQLRPWKWGMILWYQLFVNYLCLGQKQWITGKKSALISPGGLVTVPHSQPQALGGSSTSCSAPVPWVLQCCRAGAGTAPLRTAITF